MFELSFYYFGKQIILLPLIFRPSFKSNLDFLAGIIFMIFSIFETIVPLGEPIATKLLQTLYVSLTHQLYI